jgi:hypothetical protein
MKNILTHYEDVKVNNDVEVVDEIVFKFFPPGSVLLFETKFLGISI